MVPLWVAGVIDLVVLHERPVVGLEAQGLTGQSAMDSLVTDELGANAGQERRAALRPDRGRHEVEVDADLLTDDERLEQYVGPANTASGTQTRG